MPDGSATQRDFWRQASRSPRAATRALAHAKLSGPPVPEAFAYLLDWTYTVHGQSGYTMDGPVPATYAVIRDVLSAVGVEPPPTEDEMLAVRELDTAYIVAMRPKTVPKSTEQPPVREPRGHRGR